MRLTTIALCLSMIACHGSPTEPRILTIAEGLWTGDGACLLVQAPSIIPQQFRLVIAVDRTDKPCSVAWAAGNRIGVIFHESR